MRHVERAIAWILAHPVSSDGPKEALRSAMTGEPLHVADDLEPVTQSGRAWSPARIGAGLFGAHRPRGLQTLVPSCSALPEAGYRANFQSASNENKINVLAASPVMRSCDVRSILSGEPHSRMEE